MEGRTYREEPEDPDERSGAAGRRPGGTGVGSEGRRVRSGGHGETRCRHARGRGHLLPAEGGRPTGDGYVTVRGGVDWVHQREEALRAVRHRYGNAHRIDCMTKIWAAGVSAAPLGARLARAAGAETDSTGRIKVEP